MINHPWDQDVEHFEYPSRCVPSQMITPNINHYSDLFLPWISFFPCITISWPDCWLHGCGHFLSICTLRACVLFCMLYFNNFFLSKMILWPMASEILPRDYRIFLRHVLSINFFQIWYYRHSSWFYGYYFMSLSV